MNLLKDEKINYRLEKYLQTTLHETKGLVSRRYKELLKLRWKEKIQLETGQETNLDISYSKQNKYIIRFQ